MAAMEKEKAVLTGNEGSTAGQVPAAGATIAEEPKPAAETPKPEVNGEEPKAGEVKTYSADYVAELRREAAKHRTAHAEATAKVKAFEEAQLTEQEKKDKRFKELEEENSRLKSEGRRSTALVEAAKLGAVVPEAVVGLIPTDAENIGSAVAAIKKQFPALFKTPTPSGTADAGGGNTGGQAPPKRSMNDFLRAASGRQV